MSDPSPGALGTMMVITRVGQSCAAAACGQACAASRKSAPRSGARPRARVPIDRPCHRTLPVEKKMASGMFGPVQAARPRGAPGARRPDPGRRIPAGGAIGGQPGPAAVRVGPGDRRHQRPRVGMKRIGDDVVRPPGLDDPPLMQHHNVVADLIGGREVMVM